ncbi:hypothetical protein JCM33374_g1439 [Metschnikowia sp. JCM 33374]|nr:hypothetical protein JCM33374_g1439 [Metschnikowia sp. JCM 33374]
MNLSVFLVLFTALTLASHQRSGIMFISTYGDRPKHESLRFEEHIVGASYKNTGVDFQDRGAFKLTNSEKYLSFNAQGRLVLSQNVQLGFGLITRSGNNIAKTVVYNGTEVFYRCPDKSIRYKTRCNGARRGTITFREFPQHAMIVSTNCNESSSALGNIHFRHLDPCKLVSSHRKLIISTDQEPESKRAIQGQNNTLFVGQKHSAFEYDDLKGSLRLQKASKYVDIDPTGRFVLSKNPQRRFNLMSKTEDGPKEILTYRGSKRFQICGDRSIAHGSLCDGAENATILFECYSLDIE